MSLKNSNRVVPKDFYVISEVYEYMGALRIVGIVLVGIAIFLLIFIYQGSSIPEWFLIAMVLPNLIVGVLLIIAKEKSGYPE